MKTQNPFKVYKQLFLTPKTFFKAAAKETDAVTIAVFVGLFLLAGKILEFAAWVPTLSIHTETAYLPTMMLSIMGSLVSPLLTLLAILVFACFVHLAVSYFKKGTSFFSTWKVLMYASLIPIVYTVALSIVQTISEAVNPWPAQSFLAANPEWGVYSLLMFSLLFLVGVVILIHIVYTEVIGLKEYH
ncbi:hypothetical protein HZA99_04930, partial [Candidatus Woesearchaeota archaeon]|nr:hypothetical protein [Candidatus Woesearchaeota archaeon]